MNHNRMHLYLLGAAAIAAVLLIAKVRVEAVLGRRPGVVTVDANPVAQSATVTYDPAVTSVAELAGWVRDCGYHCAGQSVPAGTCDPLAEPDHGDHVSDLRPV